MHIFCLMIRQKDAEFSLLLYEKYKKISRNEKNGEILVIDFKSSKRKTKNDILGLTKNSEGGLGRQIKFYKFLWESSGREGRVASAILHFLTPERGVTQKEIFELSINDLL